MSDLPAYEALDTSLPPPDYDPSVIPLPVPSIDIPTPVSNLQIPTNLDQKLARALEEFAYLDEKIVSIHPELAPLPQLEQLVQHLNGQVTNSVNYLAQLREKTKKELNDWEGLKAGTNFKAFKAKLTGKTAEKLVKEERQYLEAKAAEEEWLKKCENVKAQFREKQQELEVLRQKARVFSGLQTQLSALLDKAFSGSTPDFPDEDRLEKDVHLAYSYIVQAGSDLPRWEQLHTCLQAAARELAAAINVMSSAQTMATVDMFTDSMWADIAKQNQVMQGRQHAAQVNAYIGQAQQLMPGLPMLRKFKISGTVMLVDLFFDNVIMDFYVRQKIQESLRDMEQSQGQLHGILNFVRNSLDQRRTNVRLATEQYEKLRGAQRLYRVEILKSLLKSGSWRSNSPLFPASNVGEASVSGRGGVSPIPDIPPPVYPSSTTTSATAGSSSGVPPPRTSSSLQPNVESYGGTSPRLGGTSPQITAVAKAENPFRDAKVPNLQIDEQ